LAGAEQKDTQVAAGMSKTKKSSQTSQAADDGSSPVTNKKRSSEERVLPSRPWQLQEKANRGIVLNNRIFYMSRRTFHVDEVRDFEFSGGFRFLFSPLFTYIYTHTHMSPCVLVYCYGRRPASLAISISFI
jgi:hypothetical protein